MPLKTIKVESKADHSTKGMLVTIDPLNAFKGSTASRLWDACGLIPYFVAEAVGEESAQAVVDSMVDTYGFGRYEMSGEVTPKGVYTHPEDPDLEPMVEFHLMSGDVTVWVYQHAIVAVCDANDTIVVRMG